MADDPTLQELASYSERDLESLWARPAELSAPRGVYRGHMLMRLDNPGARRARWRWGQTLAFDWTPFGIDFDRRLWFFFSPVLAAGRFDARPGPSRWRETSAIGLHYQVSRLPGPVRRVLYDEVKPLSTSMMLGMGGINDVRGKGDHFFFALTRNFGITQ